MHISKVTIEYWWVRIPKKGGKKSSGTVPLKTYTLRWQHMSDTAVNPFDTCRHWAISELGPGVSKRLVLTEFSRYLSVCYFAFSQNCNLCCIHCIVYSTVQLSTVYQLRAAATKRQYLSMYTYIYIPIYVHTDRCINTVHKTQTIRLVNLKIE